MPTLHWLTRDKDIAASSQAPYRLLEAVETYGDDTDTQNILIHGDNLDALKALLPFYAGKVKCIYIDPPYNTRSAFEHYDDNLEHTKWLSMLYPRLELLRELLHDDGTIWMSIDNNEGHYLKVIADEVFGRQHFIADVIWRSADSSNHDAKQFSLDHNETLVYAKRPDWLSNPLPRTEKANAHYKNPDNDPKGRWFPGNLSSPNPRENLKFEIVSPSGNKIKSPANGWRWSKDKVAEKISTGEIVFSPDETKIIRKTYLADQKGLSPSTLWDDISETGHNRQAKYELKKLFPEMLTSQLFKTPKPERLIQKILMVATEPGDIVLDSFLGSGTTAAVAQKMGRQFIGIEMGEHAETFCIPRLVKVVEGEQGGISKLLKWKGGGGFRFCRLGEPVFGDEGEINKSIRFPALAAHIWFCEAKTPYTGEANSPLLGIYNGVAYYLLFNGILGDKTVNGGNVLTTPILKSLPPHDGPKVIYGEGCRFGGVRLKKEQITFKHIPYDIKAR